MKMVYILKVIEKSGYSYSEYGFDEKGKYLLTRLLNQLKDDRSTRYLEFSKLQELQKNGIDSGKGLLILIEQFDSMSWCG